MGSWILNLELDCPNFLSLTESRYNALVSGTQDLQSKLPDLASNRSEKNTDINALTNELRSIKAYFIDKTSTDKEIIDSKDKQISIFMDELKALTDGSRDLHFQPKVHLRITHGIDLLG